MTVPPRIQKAHEMANEALLKSHSPYSLFPVGCALLTSNDTIVTGTNFESAVFPAGICAERCALGAVVVRGLQNNLTDAVVVTESAETAPPCGICLQALAEFVDPNRFEVWLGSPKELVRKFKFIQLMPHIYTSKTLLTR